MEVDDEGELSESDFPISDDEEVDWESDEDETLPETDLESSDESDDDGDNDTWRSWRTEDSDLPKHPFTVQNPGVHFPQQPDREIDAFQSFLTDDLLHEFVTATNAFATIKLHGKTFTNYSIWYNWQDVTVTEMKAYLGVILNMAINEKPDVKTYFSRSWIEFCPFFSDVFSRRRFLQIHWMLHLKAPQPSTVAVTRGSKVRNFITYLQEKCLDLYTPQQNIAVDESTVGYKGRILFKTYNPQKPTKWGIRIYVLSECDTGYICSFQPYFGKPTTDSLPWPDQPFTTRIVLHLVDQVAAKAQGSGYHVYTDRFYTSMPLARKLQDHQMHLTGTVQKNRKGLPKDLKRLRLKNHEKKVFRHPDNLMTLCWKNKRLIFMLSTWHNCESKTSVRRVRGGREEEVEKPIVISDYTEHMGAVDRADHYCASYAFTRKTLRWWRKIFFWLLEVCVVNSFILYKKATGLQGLRQLAYRKNLILQLVGTTRNSNSKKRGRPSLADDHERLRKVPHFIANAGGGRNKICMVCSTRQQRKTTVYYCETCSRKPGLHPGKCFKDYHTKQTYKQ